MEYFDLHCDTLTEAWKQNKSLYENDLHVSFKRGSGYQPWMQCFAVFIPDTVRGAAAMAYFDAARQKLQQELKTTPQAVLCRTSNDLHVCRQQMGAGALLTVEGGAVLGGKLESLDHLSSCGVRAMTLTWNGDCEIGGGVESGRGITPFGRETVRRMEELSIVVDVSHASERLFYDVAEQAQKPFIATHSNARALCGHPRNLTGEQFAVLRDRGGLVGLTLHPPFLEENGKADITSLLRHADYFLSRGGEQILCIGSDFDGADMPQGINGIQDMENVQEIFLKHYKESIVKAIFFENAYKFFTTL